MTDIVERLRDLYATHPMIMEAAAEIERLRCDKGHDASGWQPMETAPEDKNILLFAVSDIKEDGTVNNWRMASGYWSEGAFCWVWEGRQLRKYDLQPTYWMPLPEPPMPRGKRVIADEATEKK